MTLPEDESEALVWTRLADYMRLALELEIRAVPALAKRYSELFAGFARSLGLPLDEVREQQLEIALTRNLAEAFAVSSESVVVVRMTHADHGLQFSIGNRSHGLAASYASWGRRAAPFGRGPDAFVVAECTDAPRGACIDLGAGDGRNALALAKLGFDVTAVDLSSDLLNELEARAKTLGAPVRILRGDLLDAELTRDLPGARRVVAAEVTSHFRDAEDLGDFARLVARLLEPAGACVFNAFVAAAEDPGAAERQLGQICWSTFFTRSEIDAALSAAELVIVREAPVLEFERSRAAPDAWPPTPWYESWVSGRDAFPTVLWAEPRITLTWFRVERRSGALGSGA